MPPPSRFEETRWSIVRALAGGPDDRAANEARNLAWEDLSRAYQPAIEALIRAELRKYGGAVRIDEAEDICQDFLATCLEKDYLASADSERGRFRTFLAVCARRHTARYCQARHAKRRLPDRPPLGLDATTSVEARTRSADLFDEEWVRCLFVAASDRVRARSERNADLVELLLQGVDPSPDSLALRLRAPRERIALSLHRARRMLAEEVWEVLKDTTTNAIEAEEERATLFPYLSKFLGARVAPSLWDLG